MLSRFIWDSKFIFWNFIALVLIKLVFSYSGFQLAVLLQGLPSFSKEEIISQTNMARSVNGLIKLRENFALNAAANQKLLDMAKKEYFAHFSPSGVSPWDWIKNNKYEYSRAGENLAIGFINAGDTVKAWVNSPSHRNNLMNSKFEDIGVAVAPVKIKDIEGTLVVQLFGSPKLSLKVAPAVAGATLLSSPSQSPIDQSPVITKFPFQNESSVTHVADLPIRLEAVKPPQLVQAVAKNLNTVFVFYSLIIFFASAVLILFRQLNKKLVLASIFNTAMFILALTVPVFELTRNALIF